jgi:protein-S-isoprenylcysteine O-methyltransferase Ste14
LHELGAGLHLSGWFVDFHKKELSMEIFPDMELGLFNGWLLVVILYVVFGILLLIFPRPVVARLYDRPPRRGGEVVRRILGVLLVLAWIVLTILTPLGNDVVLALGLALYIVGLTGFVVALFNFAKTPLDQPVTTGLYRISRHPQQFMISVAFLGTSIAMGSWIALGLIGIGVIGGHAKVVAEEKVCLEKYGESYMEYIKRVPRYFLFF